MGSEGATGSTVPGVGVRVPVFDGIRGVAVMAVIVFHSMQLSSTDGLFKHAADAGWLGVDLFFVLSGFLITGILLDTKGEEGFFRNFYARRTLRIFPLFYAVVVVMTVLAPIAYRLGPFERASFDRYTDDLWGNQLWLWTYTQNFLQATSSHTLPGLGHLWSLAVEEQFYLLWPLVVFLVPRKHLLRVALGTCVVVVALRPALSAAGVDPRALRHWTFTRIDSLLFGGIAAMIVRDARLWDKVRARVKPVMVTCAVTVTLVSLAAGPLVLDSRLSTTLVFPIAAVGFAALLIRLCEVSAPRLLLKPWLLSIGAYSYAMYVFHWPIQQGVASASRRLGIDEALTVGGSRLALGTLHLALVTAASYLAARISWQLWERRWLERKSRFEYEASAAAVIERGKDEPERGPGRRET